MADIWKRLRLLASEKEDEDKLPKFVHLNDLASEQCGGKILFATDDWFAVAENLLKDDAPVWKEGLYTNCGKWMDGWETRRKRIGGHDWCIIKLGVPGIIHGFEINTSFFTGNHAPHFSIQAAEIINENEIQWPDRVSEMGGEANEDDFKKMEAIKTQNWDTLVEMSQLKPGFVDSCHNYVTVSFHKRYTHIRLNMFPDGGIARLRVYGQAFPDWKAVRPDKLVDLLAMTNGSVCVAHSNVHFGQAKNINKPERSKGMFDGWETARRLDRPPVLHVNKHGILQSSGFEWSAFSLGHAGTVMKIEIDTNHFKGNYPDSVSIEGCYLQSLEHESEVMKNFDDNSWTEILPQMKLSGHKKHFFESEVKVAGTVSHVRIRIYPDGGISRVRIWGNIMPDIKPQSHEE